MSKYYYDLHIHSCLSPCGDNESTPDSILGMGELNGLNLMALTDHNSAKNCPAFFKAAKAHNIIPIAGMELTTAEDIHIVCLFPTLESALDFDKEISLRRILIKNKKEIFGEQLIVNEKDEVVGEEENLLINATTVSLEEVPDLVKKYEGICYPAHIDRESNGIIAVLGAFPKTPKFRSAELYDNTKTDEYVNLTGIRKENIVVSSDAHYLWNIKEKNEYFDIEATLDDEIRKAVLKKLGDI